MTKVKSNRIFLGLVTLAMALAGTGLTIANNWKNELQTAAIAITLAACFSAAETTFLWGHKRFESSTRLWRKIVLASALVGLVCAMAYAVSEELKLALHKVSNRSLAESSSAIVASADVKNQRSLGRKALDVIGADRVNADHIPFVICYLVTGLASIAILAVTERQQVRKIKGNVLPDNPDLQESLKARGYNPDSVKAYQLKGGIAIHTKTGYQGFISDGTLRREAEARQTPDDPKKWIL